MTVRMCLWPNGLSGKGPIVSIAMQSHIPYADVVNGRVCIGIFNFMRKYETSKKRSVFYYRSIFIIGFSSHL
jgi:hypothetical protein